jgi:hypothetical protein
MKIVKRFIVTAPGARLGFKDAAYLRLDADMGILRERADFQKLLREIEKP